ncbi:penicillin-binding protein 2 [Candidatus Nomurabacteria bacterium]|nr:penicillin-binding protein 2 [Candidatus Nomurabacteria bacterium]
MTSSFVFRTRIFFLVILFLACVLIGKLFFVQIVNGETYSERADRQYSTASSDIFDRGSIYFSRKDGQNVFAAAQTTGFKVAVNPSKIVDPELTFEELSKVATIENKEEFLEKANKKNDPYEEVLNHLTKEEADSITSLKIPGVSIFKEKWRSYSGGSLASHSIGLVAYKDTELAGRYGLEKEYDSLLTRNKNNPYTNFFAEVFSNINKKLFEGEEKEGDIVTTIEPTVQNFLEKELSKVKNKYQADSIGGIIMDPKDGSIYALSSLPDFDLNNFSKEKNSKIFSNPLVENVLEFGSVVKPLVMAAALDTGVVTPGTKYEDKGSVVIEKKEIFNFDHKARGVVNMQEVLNQSLNTGMVFVYRKLGKQNMHDYLLSFGIKEKTGIDLPNESSGLQNLTNNLNNKREIEYATAAFGQGIALTPVAMIRALASLSNGGILVTPHLVKEIKYTDGDVEKIEYGVTNTKISPKTSEEITTMLVNVMDQSLKGGLAKFEHYSVAVKTGTAQVADSVNGGYYENRHTHSFFGYFPAYDPKFIVFLYALNPTGSDFASTTWTDPFLSITKFLLNYYQIPPDR